MVADIPSGVTTDQRHLPRTTTYGSNSPCVDSGSVQTNYSLAFSTQPPATVPQIVNFAAGVQLSESGSPFAVSGIGIPIALSTGDPGALNVSSLSTNSSGIAASSQLTVSAPGSSDKLVAALPLTTNPPPASLASPIVTTATSNAFNVTPSNVVHVTVSASPVGPSFSVDGVSYSTSANLLWLVGSQHTLAVTSPQSSSGTTYTFSSWSDGGSLSHTVTASTGTTSYTASFTVAYQLTTAVNPSQDGSVSPASGNYYPAGTVVDLIATANAGLKFAGWTGNVASASSLSTTITMSAPETATANFTVIPDYVVTTNLDDATGTAANCTTPGPSCSLRDALAAAAADPSGADITFDPTVFAATQPASERTITLSSAGTLNLPSNTGIFGPTTGSGATLTQLVTVNGNKQFTVFTLGSGGTNVFLTGLNILGGRVGISNSGALTVSDCTISGNSSHNPGGGIVNHGPLTVTNCTISGNAATGGNNIVGPGGGIFTESTSVVVTGSTIFGNIGGGIVNSFEGQVAVTGSTISGNSDYGIDNSYGSQVALTDSTVTGNSGYGIQVDNNSVLTVTNSIVAGNTASGSMDCSGSGCPTNGANGNLVGVAPLLAPLGNYGGPTPTMPPLPVVRRSAPD